MVHHPEPVSARSSGARPVRTCVGCRTRAVAGELLRVAVVDGALVLDLRQRVAGRGAWIHPSLDCLTKAERRRAFPRALRVPGPLDAGKVRSWLEQHTGSTTDTGSSQVRKEDRKQVDPS